MCIRTAISERYHGDGEDIDWITIPKRPPNVMLQARHCWDGEREAAASCVSRNLLPSQHPVLLTLRPVPNSSEKMGMGGDLGGFPRTRRRIGVYSQTPPGRTRLHSHACASSTTRTPLYSVRGPHAGAPSFGHPRLKLHARKTTQPFPSRTHNAHPARRRPGGDKNKRVLSPAPAPVLHTTSRPPTPPRRHPCSDTNMGCAHSPPVERSLLLVPTPPRRQTGFALPHRCSSPIPL
ncbi:hypothetical protein B0H11DRAFT_2385225 [Mycena galericulata]|nr:hypothetical protein B0H11DRAFT_2385225 [Mycena galericulata]